MKDTILGDNISRLLSIVKDKTGMDLSYCDSNTTKVTTVYIKSGAKYLSEAGYVDLPSNAYVNKQITGAGATSLCITNNVDYVIAVPNVILIKNKQEEHDNIIPFYGDVSNKDFFEMLHNSVGAKKIMVTYDSLKRLCSLINPKDYKILIDEAHQLVNIGLYRKGAVHKVLSCFRDFKEFVFITATATSFKFFPAELRDIEFIDMKWANAVKVEFPVQRVKIKGHHYLINHCLRFLRGEEEGNLHIFINSLDTIISMIRRLRKFKEYKDVDMKIICSDTEYNTAKIAKNLTTLFNEKSLRNPKKINWYTSCCWCGSDIMDEDGKVLIYVDNKLSNTKVCLKTQVPQIIGRVRNTKYPNDILMLLVGDIVELHEPNEDVWFQKVLNDFLASYSRYELYHKFKNEEFGDKVVKDMVSKSYSDPYLYYDKEDEDLLYNTMGILAEMEKYNIVHSQYWRLNNDLKPVEDSLYIACATDERIVSPVGGTDRASLGMRVNYCKTMEKYVKAHEYGDVEFIESIDSTMPEYKAHYDLIGAKKLKALNYKPSKVKELYACIILKMKYAQDIRDEMGLEVDGVYSAQRIKKLLKVSLKKHLITETVRLSSIEFFYDVKYTQMRLNGKQTQAVKILGVNYE